MGEIQLLMCDRELDIKWSNLKARDLIICKINYQNEMKFE